MLLSDAVMRLQKILETEGDMPVISHLFGDRLVDVGVEFMDKADPFDLTTTVVLKFDGDE